MKIHQSFKKAPVFFFFEIFRNHLKCIQKVAQKVFIQSLVSAMRLMLLFSIVFSILSSPPCFEFCWKLCPNISFFLIWYFFSFKNNNNNTFNSLRYKYKTTHNDIKKTNWINYNWGKIKKKTNYMFFISITLYKHKHIHPHYFDWCFWK